MLQLRENQENRTNTEEKAMKREQRERRQGPGGPGGELDDDYLTRGQLVKRYRRRLKALEDETHGYQLGAGLSIGVGLAAVTGGVVWLILGGDDDAESAVTLTPRLELTPTHGGLYGQAGWRF